MDSSGGSWGAVVFDNVAVYDGIITATLSHQLLQGDRRTYVCECWPKTGSVRVCAVCGGESRVRNRHKCLPVRQYDMHIYALKIVSI